MVSLPIDDILENLLRTCRVNANIVLVAPPGAGKTTRVPLALLKETWLSEKKIIMLEPRRLAARAAAGYMAKLLGEQVGQTVGYRVRLDSCVSSKTRIEVVTEGVLIRLLQADQSLDGVGAVIFDEFHERNLHADLGLALCLEMQKILRPDLRLLVMSATMDARPVASLLGDAPVIVSKGRQFPVATTYLKSPIQGRVEEAVSRAVIQALQTENGDILVFLPGAGEIRRVAGMLQKQELNDIMIAPLYSSLPLTEQDRAIAPSRPGERKVVLATSIAETSLTVEGIKVIIDSGLMRIPRFSPRTGMTRLETVRVARASADQRRGRAGRVGPGVCYRLWTNDDDLHLSECRPPEILEADLAPLALELAAWGIKNPEELSWFDSPPLSAFSQARQVLTELGALDANGNITVNGRKMAASGIHPRLACMIIKAIPVNLGGLACELAALLQERDLLEGEAKDIDIRLRIEALRHPDGRNPALRRKIRAEIDYLIRTFNVKSQSSDIEKCGILLSFAYPDRIAQQRSNGKFLLQNGRGAFLPGIQALSSSDWLVAAQIDDQGTDSRILLAAPLQLADLTASFNDQIISHEIIYWDKDVQAVRSRRQLKLGALIIKDELLSAPDPEEVLIAFLGGIRQEGLSILPWSRTARRLQERLIFMRHQQAKWPDMSDEALLENLEDWLAPYLYGLNSRAQLVKLNLDQILSDSLDRKQYQLLEELAPTHITVPSGQKIPIDYSNPDAPVLAVRLQELFGQKETPRIARGKVALTIHLLSPALRPVQVTKDLASFWQDAYFDVKKDLAGRYPKHFWPDDPLTAAPTNRVKAKRQ